MNVEKICVNIQACCEKLAESTLSGISLDTADPKLLEIEDADFSEHIKMQPAAIVYFGVMRKQVVRDLAKRKMDYEYWQKSKYAEAKASLGEKKPTIGDIESKMAADYRVEIQKWEDEIYVLQERVDLLESYYEGWRQKAFTLQQQAGIMTDELFTKDSAGTEKNLSFSERKQRVRDIIRKNKENS